MKYGISDKYFTFSVYHKIYLCTQIGDVNFITGSSYEGNRISGICSHTGVKACWIRMYVQTTEFWDVIACNLVDTYQRFGETCYILLQGASSTLKIEATGFSEKVLIYQTFSHPRKP
jgi:hypothetical protein